MHYLILLVLLAASAAAQKKDYGTQFVGLMDARSATTTRPVKVGSLASRPATCVAGELYFATDYVLQRRLQVCDSTNNWSDIAYSHGTVDPPTCTVGQIFVRTDLPGIKICSATNTWSTLSGGGSPTWGSITGTLSSQTDLNSALNARLVAASNLSDLGNAASARSNLGLGAAATLGTQGNGTNALSVTSVTNTRPLCTDASGKAQTPSGTGYLKNDCTFDTPAGGLSNVTAGPSGKAIVTTPVAGERQVEIASTVPTTDASTSWTGAFNLSGSSAARSFKEVATAPSGACVAADGQRLVTSGANIGELYACLNSLWTMIARSSIRPQTYWDDFIAYSLSNNNGPYYGIGSGISITRAEEGGESGTVGVMSISPGSPSWAYISSAANSSNLAAANIASANLNTYVARIRLDTADTSFGGAFGISVLSGWPNPNGMYIEKLKADTSWYCVAKDGGGTTRSSAITATTNSYVWLKVRRTASGVACSIATTYLGLIGATEYTVTANIPTGEMGMFLMADTSAASRKLYIDGWGIDAPAR